MQKELAVLDEREVLGRHFRIYGTPDEPLFLAKDIAEWIEYCKTGEGAYDVSSMLSSIDGDEKLLRTMFISGQNREMWFVTEEGLYEVLFQSRKPIAKSFKKEVKKILKEIRLTGSYSVQQKPDWYVEADNVIKLLDALDVPRDLTMLKVAEHILKIGGPDLRALLAPEKPVLPENVYLDLCQLGSFFGLKGKQMLKKLTTFGLIQNDATGNSWPTQQGKQYSEKHKWTNGIKAGYYFKWNLKAISNFMDRYDN